MRVAFVLADDWHSVMRSSVEGAQIVFRYSLNVRKEVFKRLKKLVLACKDFGISCAGVGCILIHAPNDNPVIRSGTHIDIRARGFPY
ncbi:hypothetical protein D3C76_1628780 [compost metagenome]